MYALQACCFPLTVERYNYFLHCEKCCTRKQQENEILCKTENKGAPNEAKDFSSDPGFVV